jgi:hypothetical protein
MTTILRNITNDNYYLIRKNNIRYSHGIKYNDKFETGLDWLCSILNNLITNSINSYIKQRIVNHTNLSEYSIMCLNNDSTKMPTGTGFDKSSLYHLIQIQSVATHYPFLQS